MKTLKVSLFLLTMVIGFSNCSEEGIACENNQTTNVTFTNNGAETIRLVVAEQFNAQFEPVTTAVIETNLAAGASITRDFTWGRYFVLSQGGCPANCMNSTFYAKDFDLCTTHDEQL